MQNAFSILDLAITFHATTGMHIKPEHLRAYILQYCNNEDFKIQIYSDVYPESYGVEELGN